MGLRYQGSEAQGEVELEQERRGEMDIGTTVFLQGLPKYDEWPADTTVQLKANISIVYSQPFCDPSFVSALVVLVFCISQMRQ